MHLPRLLVTADLLLPAFYSAVCRCTTGAAVLSDGSCPAVQEVWQPPQSSDLRRHTRSMAL